MTENDLLDTVEKLRLVCLMKTTNGHHQKFLHPLTLSLNEECLISAILCVVSRYLVCCLML